MSKKTVLFFGPYSMFPPHFETELELAQGHIDAGDRVVILTCPGTMPACDANPHHFLPDCLLCMDHRRQGLKRLRGPFEVRDFLRLDADDIAAVRKLSAEMPEPMELPRLHDGPFDLGYGVLSSVVCMLVDPEPGAEKAGDMARRFLEAAVSVFRSLRRHLRELRPDILYVFNGRMAPMRAAIRAGQEAGTRVLIHERGHTLQHYALFEDRMPHELDFIEQEVRRAWERAAGSPDREAVAADFFETCARRVVMAWHSYTASQEEGRLPDGWDPRARNLVFFTSTPYEFASINDAWRPPLYPTQMDALRAIAAALPDIGPNARLCVRMHPNERTSTGRDTAEMRAFQAPGVTIVPPESPVSSYDLLRAADTVLSFGSNMGIEAVFWGKPSILLGQAFYRNLGGTHNPGTHEEVIALLRRRLEPGDRTGALMYGYYWNSFGIAFRRFRATGVLSGEYEGSPIGFGLPGRILNRLLHTRFARIVRPRLRKPWIALSRRRLGTAGLRDAVS